MRITLALTGASGMPYGLRLLECLVAARCEVVLLYSQAAQIVARQECGLVLPAQPREAARLLAGRTGAGEGQIVVHGREDWMAPIASGTNPADAMAVCPCTTGTLAAIAHGLSDNLIERAADVMLKERRPLVLVPRETPLSVIHLENMLLLARAGAVVLPPAPGFYGHPRSIADLVDFVVARVLDHLRVAHALGPRWGTHLPSSRPEVKSPPQSERNAALPLFPLHTVLFPGGVLPLRVFEQRYVEMVKACLADERAFGVCLIVRGEEVAGRDAPMEAPEIATVGTTALIGRWDVPQLGILHVEAKGVARFRVEAHAVETNGLLVGQVVAIDDEPHVRLPPSFAPLAKLLELVAARVGPGHFPAECRFDDATWVGYRLAELLPLPLPAKQGMLEISDSEVRLAVLSRYLKEQKLL